ncbi:MAG: hypothetical protein ABI950_02725 [Solirubrobacteraceae bacterium]
MRLTAAALAALAAAGLAGCGGEAADLFAVGRTGAVPGGRLALRVTDDGRASCNGAGLVDISSSQLITARESARAIDELGDRRLPAGPATVFSYRVRTRKTTVAWADDSRRQRPVLFELAKLTRDIAKGPCRLPR